MKQVLIAVCVALLVTGCGNRGGTQQPKATIEQRDLFEQKEKQAADEAAKQARIQAEQDELRRQMEEQKRRQGGGDDQAVVKPLPQAGVTGKSLSDPASMLKDADSPLSKRAIYYDFDAYNIKEEFQPVVEAHAKFLLEHKDYKVRVEGSCDERGSREYNLALGQRRADSVKRALTLLGVSAKQVETVSFGSEKPKATGHDDEAWAENRRSDLVYVGVDNLQ
ncbi:MAG: peptidoglycan-associated lipoprotein Pal [Betaproteobacteria bacterium]